MSGVRSKGYSSLMGGDLKKIKKTAVFWDVLFAYKRTDKINTILFSTLLFFVNN